MLMYRNGETALSKEHTGMSSTACYLVLFMGHVTHDHKDVHGSFQ